MNGKIGLDPLAGLKLSGLRLQECVRIQQDELLWQGTGLPRPLRWMCDHFLGIDEVVEMGGRKQEVRECRRPEMEGGGQNRMKPHSGRKHVEAARNAHSGEHSHRRPRVEVHIHHVRKRSDGTRCRENGEGR